eukprot:6172075-Pleurochrysis_carterae.AAC.2
MMLHTRTVHVRVKNERTCELPRASASRLSFSSVITRVAARMLPACMGSAGRPDEWRGSGKPTRTEAKRKQYMVRAQHGASESGPAHRSLRVPIFKARAQHLCRCGECAVVSAFCNVRREASGVGYT